MPDDDAATSTRRRVADLLVLAGDGCVALVVFVARGLMALPGRSTGRAP